MRIEIKHPAFKSQRLSVANGAAARRAEALAKRRGRQGRKRVGARLNYSVAKGDPLSLMAPAAMEPAKVVFDPPTVCKVMERRCAH
jgi:hypothetical protein